MAYFLMPGKRAGSTSSLPSSLMHRVVSAARDLVAEFRPVPVPAAPAVVEPDTSEFFTADEMPAEADIAAAFAEFSRAADAVRAGERTKRRTRKLLDRLQSGRYAGWELERVESSRQVADLDAIKRIFRQNGLGELPMKSASPSLKVRRVELDLQPEVAESEFAALASAMTR